MIYKGITRSHSSIHTQKCNCSKVDRSGRHKFQSVQKKFEIDWIFQNGISFNSFSNMLLLSVSVLMQKFMPWPIIVLLMYDPTFPSLSSQPPKRSPREPFHNEIRHWSHFSVIVVVVSMCVAVYLRWLVRKREQLEYITGSRRISSLRAGTNQHIDLASIKS